MGQTYWGVKMGSATVLSVMLPSWERNIPESWALQSPASWPFRVVLTGSLFTPLIQGRAAPVAQEETALSWAWLVLPGEYSQGKWSSNKRILT